ncbi:hypothetical protein FIBSPDRAFT_1035342 [Athelia psychrophila]|uniref:Uncharacterized protein n=1 Tax=Athelia psychrophila TaxID=1759441 RepID=A0A166WZA3_9AGAM|nr:hypothetical protein FIBSPDRAFT_1035342 [Fibularhizoctonia sp. CBS 109695]
MSSAVFSRVLAHRSPGALSRWSGARAASRRLHSTALPARGKTASHIAAGVFGGLIVVAGGYTWYHFSGVKKAVDATKGMRTYLSKSKESFSNEGKASSNIALAYLRSAAKSYAGLVPGAGAFVDAAFNSVDEVFDAHQEEASLITQRAYDELQIVIHPSDASNADDKLEIAFRVISILKVYLLELHNLGTKVGGTALAPMWEKYPGAKEKVEGAFGEMKRLAESSGPGATKVLADTQRQVKGILSNNLSTEALTKARDLIRERTFKLQKDVESTEDAEKET